MTDWKKVQGDSYPELVDTTSSASTVYERRNVTEETVEMMGGEPVVVFSYEERTYTKEEYAELSSPATQAIMQAISDTELAIAML